MARLVNEVWSKIKYSFVMLVSYIDSSSVTFPGQSAENKDTDGDIYEQKHILFQSPPVVSLLSAEVHRVTSFELWNTGCNSHRVPVKYLHIMFGLNRLSAQ